MIYTSVNSVRWPSRLLRRDLVVAPLRVCSRGVCAELSQNLPECTCHFRKPQPPRFALTWQVSRSFEKCFDKRSKHRVVPV